MIKGIKKKIRNHPLVWKYYFNRAAVGLYVRESLNPIQERVTRDLKENGISFSSVEELMPEFDFPVFQAAVFDQIAEYEKLPKDVEDENKAYFDFVLGLKPINDETSLWFKLASYNKFRQISDAYFGMKNTQMRYFNIWKHRPFTGKRTGSQLWHRDREDLKILKIFICLDEVGYQNGPFTYASGTHIEGKVKISSEYFLENDGTQRSTDEMIEKVVPKEKWIKSIGKTGTIIFADTTGYHKGGEVFEGQRVIFTTMYVSPACSRTYFRN